MGVVACEEKPYYHFCARVPDDEEILDLKFRLFYEGPIGSNKLQHKHEIRRKFHEQMKELWEKHKGLAALSDPARNFKHKKLPQLRRENKNGDLYNFLYLVGSEHGISCSLDIVFLKRGSPGELMRHGADLDNRLKTLIDALKAPSDVNEMPPDPAASDEDPFFCVLEDDKYIDELKITTDRLLTPSSRGKPDDVIVLVQVNTAIYNSDKADWWVHSEH